MRSICLILLLATPLAAQDRPVPVKPLKLDSKMDFEVSGTDRFTGNQRLFTQSSDLSGAGCGGFAAAMLQSNCRKAVAVAWQRVITPGRDTMYAMTLDYCGGDWLFMPKADPSFTLLLEGVPWSPTVDGEPLREVGGCLIISGEGVRVHESARYLVTPRELFTIARAQQIAWRVYGAKGYIEGDAKMSNFTKLRRFLALLYPDSTLIDLAKLWP